MFLCALIILSGCNEAMLSTKEAKKMSIKKQFFGKTPDGQKVELYTLTNTNGLKMKVTTYGGIITELWVPDRSGKPTDVVLGYDNLDDYIKANPYFGAIIGRYGNRIAKGKFAIDDVGYTLATNNGPNHLHGGIKGFDKVVWKAKPIKTEDGPALELSYLSKDGEEGYPGNLACTVTYTLTNKNEWKIYYEAITDKPTIINLTNHSYFNLGGYDSGDILNHTLIINADKFTAVDEGLIPTGEILPVAGTPLDFTKIKTIGSRIGRVKGGYDHNYVLNKPARQNDLSWAAILASPKTGIQMQIFTTEPGLQFYSGNFLDGSNKGKGTVYNKHAGLCLETQHWPDSPNKPNFPSAVLRPGEKYTHLTLYGFSAK